VETVGVLGVFDDVFECEEDFLDVFIVEFFEDEDFMVLLSGVFLAEEDVFNGGFSTGVIVVSDVEEVVNISDVFIFEVFQLVFEGVLVFEELEDCFFCSAVSSLVRVFLSFLRALFSDLYDSAVAFRLL
jgi:hypothetical protein